MNFLQKAFPITQWLPHYRRVDLSGDLFAGLTVGIMLIPQGMAYAMIAGLPPVYGLYASIVPPLIYAIFGTSRQMAVGPVAMDSLLVAAGVSVLAVEGTEAYISFTILLAFFIGIIQLLFGLFRMGFITNLLSKPVISGFTSAAALIIGLNQLKYLLGTDIEKSTKIYEILANTFMGLSGIHWLTFWIGLGGIVIILGLKRLNKRIPGALITVGLGILLVYSFRLDQQEVAILGSIPEGLPAFQFPDFELGKFNQLLPLAFTIAVVGYVEGFSIAKAIQAKRKDYKIHPNQELIALGAANFIGSLFQSYPVTGGFSRSAVNDEAGSNTPLSSMVSAALIALTLIFLTPLFYFLPTAILASVIMVAVLGLLDVGYAQTLWRENKLEFGLLLMTFLVTLNFSMVPGIVTGVLLSILVLLFRSAYPHIAELGRLKDHNEFRNIRRFNGLEVWQDKLILRIDAPLSFINIQFIKDYLAQALGENPNISFVLLDASAISYLDATAVQGLQDIIEDFKAKGMNLILTDVVGPVRDTLYTTKLIDEIGEDHIFLTVNDAIKHLSNLDAYQHRAIALQRNA